MRRLLGWQPSALLFTAAVAAAQVQPSPQTPATPDQTKPQVTITAPRSQPVPELPPDEFRKCMGMVGPETNGTIDYTQAVMCEAQLSRQQRIVVEACVNRDGKTAPPRIIQACTELLDLKVLEGRERFYLFVNRADGYFAQGDKEHALDDYNEAVKVAPGSATPYYYRGVFYAAQSDNDAALRDFDAAIGINSKLIPALRQRAKIYQARGNFLDARQDYSTAIGLQPKTAELWSERGYVSLRQKDYDGAVKDEAEAIRLDPKLARAYFLRGAAAAFGGLGGSHAMDDIKTAVDLDPSLAGYVVIKGKTVSLALPPL